ncbi:PREDICTED: schlafen-like protein 1 [Amphimedon queenslandica]|uniref:Schlafen AlbA-2 domain-containing protein n=1 Tax=Amphimedon queenslandica TaxID=400682 RepID=A0AAN0JQF2_AMPQE|nr:PREDICTED: schlafen-like protein 1 [Amphimedon queenslandica]|eukprot:XP_019859277.1 PREDICTED: schlafen-like protein 1 [Amphimedon queenslandica]
MADSSMVYTLTPELSFSPSTARAKTTYKIGSKLVNTETRHTEYKVGNFALNNLEQHIRKYGSAFLNSGGGTLTIGIADDGTVVGVNISSESRIKRIISDEFKAFKPSVGSSYYEVDFVPTDEWDRFIIEIHIRAGEDDEIYADGEDKMYIRRDGSVQGPLWPLYRYLENVELRVYKMCWVAFGKVLQIKFCSHACPLGVKFWTYIVAYCLKLN